MLSTFTIVHKMYKTHCDFLLPIELLSDAVITSDRRIIPGSRSRV